MKISYNPARLDKIIEEYNEKIEYRKRRRAQKRGRPATNDEISDAVRAYLRGEPITDVAASLYRSVPFVRSLIDGVGVPQKGKNEDERASVYFLPEQSVSTEFESGDLVWSATKHSPATILNEDTKMDYEKKYSSKCYTIFIHETSEDYEHLGAGYYASELAYDLGSLKHLQQYNIDLKNIS